MLNKWFIIGILLMGLITTFFILKHMYIKEGRNQVISEYNLKSLTKERKARDEIIKIKSEYEKLLFDIHSQDDSGGDCPISYNAIKRLPNPHGDGRGSS